MPGWSGKRRRHHSTGSISMALVAGVGRQRPRPRDTSMRYLDTVICVWHPETDELLFEGASQTLSVEAVRAVVGPDFPQDPEPMAAFPVTAAQGRTLLGMMGHRFAGEGEFQVSREPLMAAVRSASSH